MKRIFDNAFTRKVPKQSKLLFVFVLIPLYMYCASLIITALMKFCFITFNLSLDYNAINAYLNLIVDFCLMIIAWLSFKDSMKEQWHDFIKGLKDNLIYGFAIGLALLYAMNLLGGLLTLVLGGGASSENQELITVVTNSYPLIMIVTTVIFAPILEEILFRGIIFGWLYEFHPILAHFISAFVFGFMHIMTAVLSGSTSEWTQIFAYFFMGLTLSYLYERKNNIYVPICAHMANNLLSMIMILFMK